jgi:plasmid stabilization system protein ParE
MTYTISVRSLASQQLQQAYDYYESQQVGLGVSFLDAFHQVLDLLQKQPFIFQIRYGNDVRAAVVKGYPYLIYYRVNEAIINVLAVFNTRQDPQQLDL